MIPLFIELTRIYMGGAQSPTLVEVSKVIRYDQSEENTLVIYEASSILVVEKVDRIQTLIRYETRQATGR